MNDRELSPAPVFPFAMADAGPSATYLRALLENSPIAIVVLDARHQYVMCNAAFEHLFQYTPDQLASANLDDLISLPDQAEQAARLTCAVLRETKVHTVAQRRRRDGSIVDVEIYGIPLMVDDELTGVYALYQDVTERNRARTAFREVSDRLDHLQQEERRSIARDLHDSTSQELAVLNWNLNRLTALVAEGADPLKRLVEETREIAQQCALRIRSASYMLHPPQLGDAGLAVSLAWMVDGLVQRSGLRVALEVDPAIGRFPNEIEIAIYRVVQESLANALSHSACGVIRISLVKQYSCLRLCVRDEGSRPASKSTVISPEASVGVGLRGMRERIEAQNGSFSIRFYDGGTTVLAAVPLQVRAIA